MEVHAHSHAEKKRWTHYLWEFLMLFLAVFCGFLAENFREHQVEGRREKEYMKEIVENLKYDTIRCSLNAERNNNELIPGMDSLRNELKQAINGNIHANTLYYLSFQYTGQSNIAVFNSSAITELKNSGSLRLLENKKIVSEIADYYERKISATQRFIPAAQEVNNLSNEFFSLVDLDDLIRSYDSISAYTYSNTYNYQKILQHQPVLHLLTTDRTELEKFYTKTSQYEIALKYYDFWLQYTKNAAQNLITDIQKEYHLQ